MFPLSFFYTHGMGFELQFWVLRVRIQGFSLEVELKKENM